MTDKNRNRALQEVEHGRKLAAGRPEMFWGWGSKAGQLRAKRRAALIAEGAGLKAGMNVLEIGCGTGIFTRMFADTGACICAVDISKELLDIAKQMDFPRGRVRFLDQRFEDYPGDNLFDAVVGSSVLHHLDMDKAVPRIHALLKPKGVLSFAEPNMMNPQIAFQKNIPCLKRMLGDSPEETAFIRWKLARFLDEYGFVDIKIIPFDWLHPRVPSFLTGAISLSGTILEKCPLIKEFSGSLYIRAKKAPTK